MGVTMLIVDDNSRVRMLIRRISAQEPGLHVVGEAGAGAEAIRRTHAPRPASAFLDLLIPQVNRLGARGRIQAERPKTKVIPMTVHTEDAYRMAAEASGADAFLLKKTLRTVLLPTIRRIRSSMSPPNTP